ncbi:MAG: hypothetical protein Q9186_003849 [Xanthomendoza sp. 1 TL-2023]
MRSFTLEKKVAVVTGGARGLGWNMAQALAEAGAEAIALLDKKQDLGEEAASQLSTHAKIPVRFYKTDVRDANANQRTIEQVVSDLGSVDILINSAGIVHSNIKAEDYDPEMFRRLMDINLTGSFLVSQACGQHMIKARSGGSIIFISSIAGARVLHPQQQCAYNASKAAVVQLANSLAAEWAQHGVRVNTISPGYMNTQLNEAAMSVSNHGSSSQKMLFLLMEKDRLQQQMSYWKTITPMGRVGEPDELNGLAVFLSSDAARFMTGSNVFCDVRHLQQVSGYDIFKIFPLTQVQIGRLPCLLMCAGK